MPHLFRIKLLPMAAVEVLKAMDRVGCLWKIDKGIPKVAAILEVHRQVEEVIQVPAGRHKGFKEVLRRPSSESAEGFDHFDSLCHLCSTFWACLQPWTWCCE